MHEDTLSLVQLAGSGLKLTVGVGVRKVPPQVAWHHPNHCIGPSRAGKVKSSGARVLIVLPAVASATTWALGFIHVNRQGLRALVWFSLFVSLTVQCQQTHLQAKPARVDCHLQ